MVLAKYFDLEWDSQESTEEGYSTYSKLSESDQSEFDELVKEALDKCRDDFNSFPENLQDEIDIEIHHQVEHDITIKLEDIFAKFI